MTAGRVEHGTEAQWLERGEVVAPVGPIEAKERAVGWVLGEVQRDELDAAIAAPLLGARRLEEEHLVRVRVRVRGRVRVRVKVKVRVRVRFRVRVRVSRLEEERLGRA
jgi:hypothetical protein